MARLNRPLRPRTSSPRPEFLNPESKMDAKPAWLPGLAQQAAHSEEAWLLGQPPLQRYLDYMQDTAIGGARMSRSALVDEWRTANDYWYELEQSEAGIADQVS